MSGPIREALLVLTDGTVFEGEALGATPATGVATGEVVFNTVLSGYQEVISDPSYAGQIRGPAWSVGSLNRIDR